MSPSSRSMTKPLRSSSRSATQEFDSSQPASGKRATKTGYVSYTLEELRNLPDESDWARIEAMTDDEVERSIANDPDWQGLEDIDWSKAEIIEPVAKQAISIRLDQDVLEHFKQGGPGYQSRINAVLKSYVRASQKRRAASRKKTSKSG